MAQASAYAPSDSINGASKYQVVIFSNDFQEESGKLSRDREIEAVRTIFNNLGYEMPLMYSPFSYQTLDDELDRHKKLLESSEQLIFVFMSHGTEGIVYGYQDNKPVIIPMEKILKTIGRTAPNAKKAIIFQTCRGLQYLDPKGNPQKLGKKKATPGSVAPKRRETVNGGTQSHGNDEAVNTDALRDISAEDDAQGKAPQGSTWKNVLRNDPSCRNMVVISSTLAEMRSVREFCLLVLKDVLGNLEREREENAPEEYEWFQQIFTELCNTMSSKPAAISLMSEKTVLSLQIPVFLTNMGQEWKLRQAPVAAPVEEEREPEPDTFTILERISSKQ